MDNGKGSISDHLFSRFDQVKKLVYSRQSSEADPTVNAAKDMPKPVSDLFKPPSELFKSIIDQSKKPSAEKNKDLVLEKDPNGNESLIDMEIPTSTAEIASNTESPEKPLIGLDESASVDNVETAETEVKGSDDAEIKKQLFISRQESAQLKLDLTGLQNQLRNTVNDMEDQITQKEVTLSEVLKRVSQLQEALGTKQELAAKFQLANTALEQEAAGLRQAATLHQGKVDQLQKEKDGMISRLSEFAKRREQQTKEFESKLEKQEKEIENLNENIKGYQNQLRLVENQNRQLEKQIADAHESENTAKLSSSSTNSLEIDSSASKEAAQPTVGKSKKALMRKIETLQKQIDKLEQEAQQRPKEPSATVEAGLEEQVHELQAQVREAQRLQKEAEESLQSQLAKEADVLKLKSEVDALQQVSRDAQDSARQLQLQMEEKLVAIKTLESELESLRLESAQNKAALSAKETEISLLAEQEAVLVKQKSDVDSSVAAEYKSQIDALDKEMAAVKKQLQEEEEKKSKSIQLLRNSKTRILKLEADKRDLETSVRALESQTAELKAAGSKAAADYSSLEKAHAALKATCDKLEAEGSAASKAIADLRSEKERLLKQIDNLHVLAKNKKTEFEEKLREIEQRSGQVEPFIARIKELERNGELLSSEIEANKATQLIQNAENDQLKYRVIELERQVYSAEQSASELKEMLRGYEQETALLKRERDDLQHQIADSQSDRDRLKDENAQLQERLDSLSALLAARETVAEEAKARLFLLEQQEQQLTEQLKLAARAPPAIPECRDAATLTVPLEESESASTVVSPRERHPLPSLSIPLSVPKALNNAFSQSSLAGSDSAGARNRAWTSSAGANVTGSASSSQSSSLSSLRNSSQLSLQLPGDGQSLDLQYLKSVIIKYFEKKDMRKQLLPVVSTLLHLSNDEMKRLSRVN